jgi:hypothetical protein
MFGAVSRAFFVSMASQQRLQGDGEGVEVTWSSATWAGKRDEVRELRAARCAPFPAWRSHGFAISSCRGLPQRAGSR